jgi:NifU-like protein involved in Fe-S cluster formation
MNNHIVESYIQNPTHNYILENPTISYYEWNSVCGDDITVYLSIEEKVIINYSYNGNCSNITKAAASFLWDIIVGEKIENILSRDIQTIEKHDFIVSPRRKRAAVIALLATRNAIHTYLHDEHIDTFDTVLHNI